MHEPLYTSAMMCAYGGYGCTCEYVCMCILMLPMRVCTYNCVLGNFVHVVHMCAMSIALISMWACFPYKHLHVSLCTEVFAFMLI